MSHVEMLATMALFRQRIDMAPRNFIGRKGNNPHQSEREMLRRRAQIALEGGETYYGVPIWDGAR